MSTALHLLAMGLGILLLVVYFRSIVVVALLNSTTRDFVERGVRRSAVAIVHGFIRPHLSYAEIQQKQARILPLFVLFAVLSWFVMVQLAFTCILWGLSLEPDLPRALAASGSALSTLGFLTPPTVGGQYLAIFQAAIGLAVVMLLFTFVPGFLAATRTRELRVGWLFARTGGHTSSELYLGWLLNKKEVPGIDEGWEDWERWFRGIRETHTLAPILTYVPSIYAGTSWLAASLSVLDTAAALVACLGERAPPEVRICLREGSATLRLTAAALEVGAPPRPALHDTDALRFDRLHDAIVAAGLPVPDDRDACFRQYAALHAEFAPCIEQIAAATLTPRALLDIAWDAEAPASAPATDPRARIA